jgi:Mg-chelatase subunit ChlD
MPVTTTTIAEPAAGERERQRVLVHWRTLAALFGQQEQAENVESMARSLAGDLDLPPAVLDASLGIDTLLHRYPELASDFAGIETVLHSTGEGPEAAGAPEAAAEDESEAADGPSGSAGPATTAAGGATAAPPDALSAGGLRRSFAYSKLLLNVFGPVTMAPTVTAQQYHQWVQDCARFEAVFGHAPGGLRGRRGSAGGSAAGTGGGGRDAGGAAGGGAGASTSGTRRGGGGADVSEEALREGLAGIEKELVNRMALREVLKDDAMAASLSPSMTLVEQLLRDKAHLSGNALKNAKRLIGQYVDQLAEVLKLQVMRAVKGKVDQSVPPKRVFRNLDLKRTVWQNLTHYNPADGRLYVDRLHYKRTAKKSTPIRMIVVVDQSGSMVDAMVQCTILASIFASLPRVDMHLLAFDTRVLDLTPWVHDPFEVLLRTELGGGTLIKQALEAAAEKVEEPRNTAVVLISDFFEGGSNQELLDAIKAMRDAGTHVIPVGAVTSGGYFSVNDWFRTRLKDMGMPILTGKITKLIEELKKLL